MMRRMKIRIEDASVKDLDQLCEIEAECFKKEAFTRRQMAQLLADYNSISLLAKENSTVIGFITGAVRFDGKQLTGHILTLDVRPAHRRRGIGRRLLQELETIFRKKNIMECYLEAREDNVAALKLYERVGYERIRKLSNYYGDTHGIYLRKVLTQF